MNNIIEISNLSKSYNDLLAVSDISFKVKEGEFFAFLGVNGAGKSTTISIMCGQLSKDSGEVIVNGHNLDKDIDKVRKDIGVVFQASALDKPLSVKDNLKYRAGLYGICGAEFEKKLNELCKLFDLDEILNRPIKKLSGGQKRRVDIARALLHDPKILILDEPTSALDPATAKYIHELVLEEKAKGTTIFLTTHNMEEATKLCDQVALLNEGKIMEYGSPQEICGRYNKQNQIEVLLADGQVCIINIQPEAGSVIKEYFEKGLIRSIHSLEPNLETVFMEITGRKLV